MEKPHEKSEGKILKAVTEKLMEAQQEIDEWSLQLALGKAEAKDKFEELKKEFANKLNAFKQQNEGMMESILFKRVNEKIAKLEILLEASKVESLTVFEEQKVKLLKTLEEIEVELKDWFEKSTIPHAFEHEVEKFKLKLEILRLRFDLKKFELKDSFRNSKADIKQFLEKMDDTIQDTMEEGRERLDHIRTRVASVYSSWKKALKD